MVMLVEAVTAERSDGSLNTRLCTPSGVLIWFQVRKSQ
jgi:hypothetical protein